ncbi:hypothetical protein HDV00_010297 [Rhizophlyctis rosea]|nr:hypothetical protein HDV00_010297 [Rhizophlyctis rosea]
MGVSFIGTMLPILFRRVSRANRTELPFHSIKLFGAGVILCTAFVHMFAPAQEILTNECLPQVFHDYEAWAGAIALFGVLFTHLFQVLAASYARDRLMKNPESIIVGHKTQSSSAATVHRHDEEEAGHHHADHSHNHELAMEEAERRVSDYVHQHSDGETGDHAGHAHGLALEEAEKRIATYALELGVAIHSVIIGVTLGAARGQFISLLIALTFHQFFEGIALASVILDATYTRRGQAIVMVLFYSLTTPLGITIGVIINESYNMNATNALISTGVLEALSAGILAYDSLVNIICPHFNGRNFLTAAKPARIVHFFFLWLGAFAMALIGRWA